MARYGEFPEFLRAPRQASHAPAPVLVLNVGWLALHHGGVGILRSLGRLGVPVYAIVDDRFTPACVCRYLAGAILWDTRRLDAQRFIEGMAWIGRRLQRPTVVIPNGDVAASLVAEHAAVLERWFLLPKQPATLPRLLANKRELRLLCDRIGVACPRTVFPACMEDVHDFVAGVPFPIVVKAAAAWHLHCR
jgi:D-aspartate ligase